MPRASKKATRPSFYEVVFDGRAKVVHGLLAGLQTGCGEETKVIYHDEAGIYDESATESFAEKVGVRKADYHVVVDSCLADMLRKQAGRISEETGLVMTSCRNIRSAELPFKFTVYARPYQREIMKLIKELPDGLRLVDFVYEEDIHPEAEGVEAYAPVHDYTARGEGKIVGRVDLLVAHRRKLAQQALIDEGKIRLKLA
jgi:hypothetical protein